MNLYLLQRKHISLAAALFFVAVIVRMAFTTFYPVSPMAGGDPKAYWSFAQGIFNGEGFRSTVEPWLADRPPLYPYFLATIFLLFGENQVTVFTAQSMIGALASMLFYLCGVRLLGEQRGLIAGLLFVFTPQLLLFSKHILTEALYLALLVALLAILVLPAKLRSRHWALAGISLGMISLCRREALLPAGLIALLYLYQRTSPDKKAFARGTAALIVIAGLTLAPWLVRNWRIFGAPLLSSSGGWNFLVGNNPAARGGYTAPPAEWAAQFTGLDELGRDQKAWELTLGWIREDPFHFIRLLPHKLIRLWGPANNLILDSLDLVFIPFYLLGLARSMRREPGWAAVASIAFPLVGSVTLLGLVFVGEWRYRIAAYPGLLMLAAYGIPSAWLSGTLGKLRFPRFGQAKTP